MSADSSLDLNLQLLVHMESLRTAGILFLPRGIALELPSLVLSKNEAYDPQNAVQYAATSNLNLLCSRKPSQHNHSLPLPPAPQPETPDGRRHALKMLASEIGECNLCGELYSTRTHTVFGVGPIDPEIAFVGEAPGADEDRLGEPFVGRVGYSCSIGSLLRAD